MLIRKDREALKAAANDVFDAIEATIKEGQIDGGASLNASPDSLTFVAGVHVKEPAKIEDALKKLEAVAKKQPDFPGIKWNAANHAGVNFHTLSAPVPEDKKGPRKMFGETLDVAIGIGPDAVYVAVGKDNIAAVEQGDRRFGCRSQQDGAAVRVVAIFGPNHGGRRGCEGWP